MCSEAYHIKLTIFTINGIFLFTERKVPLIVNAKLHGFYFLPCGKSIITNNEESSVLNSKTH
jgi:hypothetical protein